MRGARALPRRTSVVEPGLIPVEVPVTGTVVALYLDPLIDPVVAGRPYSSSIVDDDVGSFAAASAVARADEAPGACLVMVAPVPPAQLPQDHGFERTPDDRLRLVFGFLQPEHAESRRPLAVRIVGVIRVVAHDVRRGVRHRERVAASSARRHRDGAHRHGERRERREERQYPARTSSTHQRSSGYLYARCVARQFVSPVCALPIAGLGPTTAELESA